MGFSREGGSFTTVKDYIKSTPTCKSIGYAFAPSPSFVPHSHPFFVSTAVTSSRCEPILIVSNKCSLSFVNRQGTICKTLIYSFYVIIFHLLLADVYRFDLFVILCKMLQYRTILEQNHVFFFFFCSLYITFWVCQSWKILKYSSTEPRGIHHVVVPLLPLVPTTAQSR